jgi:hypothetical protein
MEMGRGECDEKLIVRMYSMYVRLKFLCAWVLGNDDYNKEYIFGKKYDILRVQEGRGLWVIF